MEIEPDVFNVWVLHLSYKFCELVADSLLRSLLVNQVHEVLLLVYSVGLSKMFLGSLERLVKVIIHDDCRTPFHVRLHAPLQGDRPTDLKVRCNSPASSTVLHRYYLLCFTEVSCRPIAVKASHNEPATRSSTVFSRDQDEVLLWVNSLHTDISINHWHSEWCILDVTEFF